MVPSKKSRAVKGLSAQKRYTKAYQAKSFDQGDSRLPNLPPELRGHIYVYSLTDQTNHAYTTTIDCRMRVVRTLCKTPSHGHMKRLSHDTPDAYFHRHQECFDEPKSVDFSILRVCREIHAEAALLPASADSGRRVNCPLVLYDFASLAQDFPRQAELKQDSFHQPIRAITSPRHMACYVESVPAQSSYVRVAPHTLPPIKANILAFAHSPLTTVDMVMSEQPRKRQGWFPPEDMTTTARGWEQTMKNRLLLPWDGKFRRRVDKKAE
ncbi:hypothetical protein LTR86_006345 [Recurvomyces mirabilis]|nr:hypothetical protein LTR86_006345 [Recurvomyces mirabilis]